MSKAQQQFIVVDFIKAASSDLQVYFPLFQNDSFPVVSYLDDVLCSCMLPLLKWQFLETFSVNLFQSPLPRLNVDFGVGE